MVHLTTPPTALWRFPFIFLSVNFPSYGSVGWRVIDGCVGGSDEMVCGWEGDKRGVGQRVTRGSRSEGDKRE